MFRAVFLATLCVAVLAHRDHKHPNPGPPEGSSGALNEPHVRVARQMPGGSPQVPEGMNPAQFPQMMALMAQKGAGMAASVMDPQKWMSSPMSPHAKK